MLGITFTIKELIMFGLGALGSLFASYINHRLTKSREHEKESKEIKKEVENADHTLANLYIELIILYDHLLKGNIRMIIRVLDGDSPPYACLLSNIPFSDFQTKNPVEIIKNKSLYQLMFLLRELESKQIELNKIIDGWNESVTNLKEYESTYNGEKGALVKIRISAFNRMNALLDSVLTLVIDIGDLCLESLSIIDENTEIDGTIKKDHNDMRSTHDDLCVEAEEKLGSLFISTQMSEAIVMKAASKAYSAQNYNLPMRS